MDLQRHIAVYRKRKSGVTRPIFSGSNIIHQADSNAVFYKSNLAMLSGEQTWLPATSVNVNDYVSMGSPTVISDISVDVDDPTIFLTSVVFQVGYQIRVNSGTGFNVGNYFVGGTDVWVASTLYTVGSRATKGGNLYEIITQGTTASSGGPSGTGADITDGTAHWKWIRASTTRYTACTSPFGTPISIGTVGSVSGTGYWYSPVANNIYKYTQAGTTGTTTGPTGTSGTPAFDGTAKYVFVSASSGLSTPRFIGSEGRLFQQSNTDPHLTKLIPGKDGIGLAGRCILPNKNAAWVANTSYLEGQTVKIGTRYYRATNNGTSAASGTGPALVQPFVTDNTIIWSYLGQNGQSSATFVGYKFASMSVSQEINTTAWVRHWGNPATLVSFAIKHFRLPTSTHGSGGVAPQASYSIAAPYSPPGTVKKSYLQAYVGSTDQNHTYPTGNDQGTQPFGPYFEDMIDPTNPLWYQFTWSFRAPTAIGKFDGYFRVWINDVLVINVSKDGLNRTPPGGEKQYCGIDELTFMDRYIGDVTDAADYPSFGGVQTQTQDVNQDLMLDYNFGVPGDPGNCVVWWNA